MPSRILNFSKDRLITGINIIDGMLFFVDNETEPKKINIKKFRGDDIDGEFKNVQVDHSSGTTSIYNRPFEERDITVIKDHPQSPISTDLISAVSDDYYNDGDDIIDTDDGGNDIIVDLPDNEDDDNYLGDNDNLNTTSTIVATSYASPQDLQNFFMRGTISHSKNIIYRGFYYTFDASVAVNAETMLASLNDKTFKYTLPVGGGGSFGAYFSSESSSPHYDADGFGNQSGGDTVYYMAYAQEATEDFERYGSILNSLVKDNTDDGSGTISDFTCTVTYSNSIILETVGLVAEYTDDGGGTINAQHFVVSKGYPNWDLPATPPTAEQVAEQAGSRRYDENPDTSGFVSSFPNVVEPGALSALGAALGATNPNGFTASTMPALEDGFTYYVYAFMSTSSQPEGVYSNRAEFNTNQVMPPTLKHYANIGSDRIILKAELLGVGSPSTISEKGFYFSKNVTQLEDLKKAFDAGVEADYTPSDSGYTDTYKVAVAGDIEVNDEWQLSTFAQMGALEPEETIYYLAYAKNSLGATGFASESGYISGGEIGEATTPAAEDLGDPIVVLSKVTSRKTTDGENINLNFEYSISFMPGNVAPQSSGVRFSLPSGNEIELNKNGFDTYTKVDQSKRSTDVARNKFTFTSSGDSTFLGDYNTTSDYVWPYFDEADRNLWIKAYGLEESVYTFIEPHASALSAYAYVVHNNVTYRSEPIKLGAEHDWSGTFGGGGFADGCYSWNMGAPTVQTQDNNGRAYTNPASTSVTMEGRICNNGGSPGANPISDIGFYWSLTDAPDIPAQAYLNDEKETAIQNWIGKSTTFKKSVTRTLAMQAHQSQDDDAWFEFDAGLTSSDGISSGDTLYFLAFVKPRPQSTYGYGNIYSDIIAGLNKTKYGNVEYFNFLPTHTAPQSGEEPVVSITNVVPEAPGTSSYPVVFKGSAYEKADYYNITTKGFYYKPQSEVTGGASATQSAVKTAMASSNSRTTISTTSFASGSSYAKSANVTPGDYWVSAFCIVNTNGTSTTYISNNSIKLELPAITVVPEATTPVVITKAPTSSFPVTLQGEITQNAADITDRGFYVVGKKAEDFTKPSNGAALKALHDSPTTGVVVYKITNANSYNLFYKEFTNQKKGYVYYYAAYATNTHGKEGLANNIFRVYEAENISKFLEVDSPIISVDSDGNPFIFEGAINSGADLLIRVKTEGGYNGNWRIKQAVKWNGTSVWVYAYRRNNYGEWKLSIPRQEPNGSYNRRATLRIVHGSDANIYKDILLSQENAEVDHDQPNDYLIEDGLEIADGNNDTGGGAGGGFGGLGEPINLL